MTSPSNKRIRLADIFHSVKPSLASSEDLLNDIFLRLPAKTLFRFKCVCKHWKSFISDPEFAKNHVRRHAASYSTSNPSGVYFYSVFTSKYYGVSFAGESGSLPSLSFLGRRIVLEFSCNGLILCWNNDTNLYVVCNLSTRQCKTLSIPESIAHFRHNSYLAFDPSKSPFFKVAVLTVFGYDFEFHIYSSEKASWKIVRTKFYNPWMLHFHPVFYKGKLHWIVGKQSLMGFDVEKQKFSSVELPEHEVLTRYDCIRHFGLCKGNLVLVLAKGEMVNCFNVLEMNGAHTWWVVKAKIDLSPPTMLLPEGERAVVMCVLKTGKDEYDLVLAVFGEIVLYSMKTKIFEIIDHMPDIELKSLDVFPHGSVYYPFMESLVQI